MKKLTVFIVLYLIFLANSVSAQMPVEVLGTTPDIVGQRLVNALKERIHSSSLLSLSLDQKKVRMQAKIVTLNPNQANIDISTMYAIVILLNTPSEPVPFYLDQYVGVCGNDHIYECANALVVNIAEQADTLIKTAQETH